MERFQQLLERQENEEIRAIYSANSYSLAATQKSFQVDSVRWHSWDKETRENHIKKMRNYTPTPSHAFDKPSNARRKPSSITRKKMNSTQKCQLIEFRILKKSWAEWKISVCISVNHLQQMSGDLHHPKLRTATISDFLTFNQKYLNFTRRKIYQNS